LRGIAKQVAIGGDRLVGVVDDDELAARLEPALDALVRVRDDRGAAGGELEGPARRRREHGRVGPARDVEVDPGRGDRTWEHVERDVADESRPAGVAPEVGAAERDVELGQPVDRLHDQRRHTFAPEIVAVRVAEYVGDLLLLLLY